MKSQSDKSAKAKNLDYTASFESFLQHKDRVRLPKRRHVVYLYLSLSSTFPLS